MRTENHEGAAFQKAMAGMRHAEEGFAELAMHRSDSQFMQAATLIKQLREKLGYLAAAAPSRVRGS